MRAWCLRLACILTAASPALTTALAQKPAGKKQAPTRLVQAVNTIVEDILREHNIAGASIAIAKDGRLVMARGYGLANVAKKEPVRPDHLFCIGSVTKSVTAVAVLKLFEEGKLDLDDPVMNILARLKPLGEIADRRVRRITVRHLLYHAAGWDAAKRGQPPAGMVEKARALGVKGPLTLAVCYRIALTERLDFAPGTEDHYSNFGFFVLRLVIEAASGQDYEKYVREQILAPMGITRMRLEFDDYGPGEVRRYAAGGVEQLEGGFHGGFPLVRSLNADRASGGNWVASASDLARFLTALEGGRGRPFLKPRTRAQMLAPPPPPYKKGLRPTDPHVGLGWDRVRRIDKEWRYGKSGGRAGVSAWVEHLPDGICWSVLFNTSVDKEEGKSALAAACKRIPLATSRVEAWPDRDLFEKGAK